MINTIYILKNKINGKVYIGQTWRDLNKRWESGYGYRNCIYLNNAIQKHGKENFYYEILTFCSTQESADFIEDYFITKYNSTNSDKGYNIRRGGSIGKLSENTKAKISFSLRGKTHSEETKIKMSKTSKLRKVNVGKKASKETKNKLSLARLGNKSNTGKSLSEETKNKISKFSKGKTWILINNKRTWVDK